MLLQQILKIAARMLLNVTPLTHFFTNNYLKYLFAENSSAIRKSSGIPMLQYAQKILKSFNMTQMAVVTYAAGNEQLAEQRAAVVQSYMWDAHVYARIVFKKVEPISSHSHENPRVELQIQLAK